MNTLFDTVSISDRSVPSAVRLALIGGLLTVALAAAGCGGSGSSTAGGGTPPPAGGGSPGGGSPGGGSPPPSPNPNPNPSPNPNPNPGPGGQAASTPVVYIADQELYERYELYISDPATAGGSVKLNGALPSGADVDYFTVIKNGAAVVYIADANIVGRSELYLVNVASPGTATRLNTPLTLNRDVLDFAVSPDGTKVVYRADQNADDVYELYMVNLATPGVSEKLSANLVPDGWVRSDFSFNHDGTRMIYRADQDVAGRTDLYIVDTAVPGVTKKVNPSLVAGGNVYSAFSFSPDGVTIAYVADQETDETLELFAASASLPGTTQKLSGPLIADGDVCRFEFSPDSQRVAYCADEDTNDTMELYTVALSTPGQSVKVNPPLAAGGKVTSNYEFSLDSSSILYTAQQDDAARKDLYRVEVAAPGIASRLNPALPPNGNVVEFELSPDGKRIGYMANQEDVGKYELFETDFMAPGASTKLSAPQAFDGVYAFHYAASGSEVIYVAAQNSDVAEVYRVDLATPRVSTKASGTLVVGGEVWDYGLAQ